MGPRRFPKLVIAVNALLAAWYVSEGELWVVFVLALVTVAAAYVRVLRWPATAVTAVAVLYLPAPIVLGIFALALIGPIMATAWQVADSGGDGW